MADRELKTPFDSARKIHARIKRQAMARGLISYPMGGTIDGVYGDHVLLAPPYTINADEIDLLIQRITQAIDAAIAE